MHNRKLFCISPALIAENFKMYWFIPVVSFIGYFFGGIFPIITRHNQEDTAYLLWHSLHNFNAAFIPLLFIMPLVAACVAMSFMHNESRSLAFHSQPYSKSRLFNSQILSGWLLCLLPILLTAVLFCCFRHDVAWPSGYASDYVIMNGSGAYSQALTEGTQIYTYGAIFDWFTASVAIMTLFYATYILAGSLVGTSIMQVLLSGVFFVIIPVITWITSLFCDAYVIGYAGTPEIIEKFMLRANPIFYIFSTLGSQGLTTKMGFAYFFSGLFMLVLARLAYDKAKLEKVGDSMIFKPVEEAITYLITFVGMSSTGLLLSADSGKGTLLAGVLAGGLTTFVVVKIIIARSIKIFNKSNLVSLGIYTVIAAIFLSLTVFNLSGFTSRVPDISDIKSVDITSNTFSVMNRSYYISGDFPDNVMKTSVQTEDPETIGAMLDLHHYIVDNELYIDETAQDNYALHSEDDSQEDATDLITLRYTLKDNSTFTRMFTILADSEVKDKIDKILASPAAAEAFTLGNKLDLLDISSMQMELFDDTIYGTDDSYDTYRDTDSADYEEDGSAYADEDSSELSSSFRSLRDKKRIKNLIHAMDQDIVTQTYDSLSKQNYENRDNSLLFSVTLTVTMASDSANSVSAKSVSPEARSSNAVILSQANSHPEGEIMFDIYESDTHAVAYLKKIGYI